jgi:hypothetical protein
MQIGESNVTNNPAVLLKRETGTFLVWGPAGQVDRYICKANSSIDSVEFVETREARNNYQVEKIADTATTPLTRSASAGGHD